MSIRDDLTDQVVSALGHRRLIYFGTRGADAWPLFSIPQLHACVSLIAPLPETGSVRQYCLETERQYRVDLDRYSLDADTEENRALFRYWFRELFSTSAAVLPYRSCGLLSSSWFPRSDRVLFLGMFHEHQAIFEHKPWVEDSLRRRDVPVLNWKYFPDEDRGNLYSLARFPAIVIRASRSDGGARVRLVRETKDLATQWPDHTDGFVSVSKFLEPSIPLNLHGTVFRVPGQHPRLVAHPPSFQIIGVPCCTSRRFGYCGNDFAAIRTLPKEVMTQIDTIFESVGMWLAEHGYVGAFGVDMLVHEGQALVTEINPRFQGCSSPSAIVDHQMDRPSVFLTHLAALLGIRPPHLLTEMPSELASRQAEVAHVVAHNLLPDRVVRKSTRLTTQMQSAVDEGIIRLLPAHGYTAVENEGALFQRIFDESVTSDGFTLRRSVSQKLHRAIALFEREQAVLPLQDSARSRNA